LEAQNYIGSNFGSVYGYHNGDRIYLLFVNDFVQYECYFGIRVELNACLRCCH